MDCCLLCLKVNEKFEDCISTNSFEWQDLNIQHIIEKYLWKVDPIFTFSYICQGCWQELNNFHKFYTNIKQAYENFKSILKIEHKVDISNEKSGQIEKDYNSRLRSRQLKPEIFLIREENPLEIFEKEDTEEFLVSKRNLKRAKLKCSKSTKRIENEVEANDRSNLPTDEIEKECNRIKQEKQIAEISNESGLTEQANNTLNDGTDSDDKNECVKENDIETTNVCETHHKVNLYYKPLTKRQEFDKYIAEHQQITCCVCQLPMATFSILVEHFNKIHNQRGYVICCKRKFFDRSELIDHINVHKNPEYFKCKDCNKVLSNRSSLRLHSKKIHEKNIEKCFNCDICGKSLANKYGLKIHKLRHDAENQERIHCKECGKSFRNNFSLSNHTRVVHLKKYNKICHLCGISIAEKIKFKHHMLEHQGKPVPKLSCEFCGRRLADKKCLRRHITSHHPSEGVKPKFNCHICEKVFASLANVKKHIKVVHENSYENKCTLCDKSFKRPDALRDHVARHTGTPLHACGWCPKTFYSNGQMYAHRKNVHPEEWQESIREKFSGNLPDKYKISLASDEINTHKTSDY